MEEGIVSPDEVKDMELSREVWSRLMYDAWRPEEKQFGKILESLRDGYDAYPFKASLDWQGKPPLYLRLFPLSLTGNSKRDRPHSA